MLELQVKAKIKDKELLMERFAELGINFTDPIVQEDKIFLRKEIKIEEKRPEEPILRIRKQNGKSFFTLKYSRSTELDKVEYESEISDPKAFEQCLYLMNYYLFLEIYKVRRKTRYNKFEICIDEVKDLGDYIEVEIQADQADYKVVEEEIWKFLKQLGLNESDKVTNGYYLLLYNQKQGNI